MWVVRKAGILTPAQADLLDSLASPMTALGLGRDVRSRLEQPLVGSTARVGK